ncbi:B12-binding domain-containing radical SAM protein [Desulfatibacillum aliphaticivorans]|uniref:B12-binding domain-containing radical SAM protein n=1 Tax=Desulfatibacillum aliphaticivorans TaxID=218208 RepID=UPI00040551B0|nr:radical SAM protein [Desulfatibacillum aliphaticivorans]
MILNPKKIRRALFLLPGPYVYEDRCQSYIGKGSFFGYREPVEEMYAAGVLGDLGLTCRVVHAAPERLSKGGIEKIIGAFAPDLVVISSTYPGHVQDLAWAEKIKKVLPRAMVIARGGHMGFIDRQDLLKRFSALDGVIRGETEFTLRGFFQSNDKRLPPGFTLRHGDEFEETPDPGLDNDITALPFPARRLLNHRLYRSPVTARPMATISANRGCCHRCVFCPAHKVSGAAVRLRSPESIVREIRECREHWGIQDFFMRGETFTASRAWLKDLCRELKKQAPGVRWLCNARADAMDFELAGLMKSAGLCGVSMGAESPNADTLALIRKDLCFEDVKKAVAACRSHGIMTMVYFLMGFLWETREDIVRNIEKAGTLKSDVTEFFFPYPLPGAELYETAKALGLINDRAPLPWSQQAPVFIPQGLSAQELMQLRARARRNPAQNIRAARAVLRQASGARELAAVMTHGFFTAANALFRA